MKWYVLEKNANLGLPEWARTFGLGEDDMVYIPAAVTQMPEQEVYLRFQSDSGASLPSYNDHLYLPVTWLSREYPETADLCELFEHQAEKIKTGNIL